jgi:hypothetical protein
MSWFAYHPGGSPWNRLKLVFHYVTAKLTGAPWDADLDWDIVWVIVKPTSSSWWWVRRWGPLPCGCTRNPLTHRMVLYRYPCETHFPRFAREEVSD